MESLGNTRNDYSHEWIAIGSHKGNFLQMMDSFGFGQILLIAALICWVVYTLLARKVLAGIDSLTATTLSSIFGFLLLFMSALCVESTDDWLTVLIYLKVSG